MIEKGQDHCAVTGLQKKSVIFGCGGTYVKISKMHCLLQCLYSYTPQACVSLCVCVRDAKKTGHHQSKNIGYCPITNMKPHSVPLNIVVIGCSRDDVFLQPNPEISIALVYSTKSQWDISVGFCIIAQNKLVSDRIS